MNKNLNLKPLAGLGVVAASLVVSASSRADFLGATIVEVTEDVGTPEGFVTYRVVANFDGMDVVLAWGGADRLLHGQRSGPAQRCRQPLLRPQTGRFRSCPDLGRLGQLGHRRRD